MGNPNYVNLYNGLNVIKQLFAQFQPILKGFACNLRPKKFYSFVSVIMLNVTLGVRWVKALPREQDLNT